MEDKYGFKFREWDIYKDSRIFRIEINSLLKRYPKFEMYALVDQTKRALNSILLNLAEGSNKNTDKDTRVYVNRSHGSLDEVVACLDCGLDDGYVIQSEHARLLEKASSIAQRLKKFNSYLSKTPSKTKD
jgi:four helix bundle protein